MKRIINGKAYDTDTAELIARGDHDHEMSQASWSLYRTRNGAYFEVYAGHDGVVESFEPFTDAQARRFLETNANHLVEEYFGPAPEAAASTARYQERFSRRTVLAAIDVLAKLTQAQMTRFLLDLGPEFPRWVGDESKGLAKRLNRLIEIYDQQPDRSLDQGEAIADALVDKAVSLFVSEPSYPWQDPPEPPESERTLRYRLALDGYVITDRQLRAALPQDVGLPGLQDELRSSLKRHKFETALGHLDQAVDGHARGNWASSNSQLRSFFEGILDEMAAHLAPETKNQSGESRRTKLAQLGLLQTDLNEWSADGKNFVNGLMKRLHPQGSHPGLSDQRDSTFRLHLVLLTAHFLMTRFNELIKET
jgi:hypothetical protein